MPNAALTRYWFNLQTQSPHRFRIDLNGIRRLSRLTPPEIRCRAMSKKRALESLVAATLEETVIRVVDR